MRFFDCARKRFVGPDDHGRIRGGRRHGSQTHRLEGKVVRYGIFRRGSLLEMAADLFTDKVVRFVLIGIESDV